MKRVISEGKEDHKIKQSKSESDADRKLSEKLHGNYNAYYTLRRVPKADYTIDPRIDLIQSDIFRNKHVLDIGCNSGNVTIALAKLKKPEYILGVDIDETLIQKANLNLKVVHSLSDPEEKDPQGSFDLTLKSHYFPIAMTHLHGYIPFNIPPDVEVKDFPYNIEFKAVDWTKEKVEKEQYDTVLALSVTKWIHLYTGDEGIKEFFKKIYNSLKVGGTFVLEAQDFSTYQKRAKNIDSSMDVKETFMFKPDQFTEYLLSEVGFKSFNDLGVPENEKKGFSRPVILYTK